MSSVEADHLERLLGHRPRHLDVQGGGDIARSFRVTLHDGKPAMAKFRKTGQPGLKLEASMLDDLRKAGLPVPTTLAVDDDVLVLDWVDDGHRRFSEDEVQRAAGAAIATLHQRDAGPAFGYGHETVLGSIPQPNHESSDWIAFFRDQRLLHMANRADDAGELPATFRKRLDDVASRLAEWIPPGATPSLVHGDLWGGNMLPTAEGGACFIDPAIYHGHGEVDLALATLFGSVGPAFFDGYGTVRELEPRFMPTRRHLYNLYPLLLHVTLFGQEYLSSLDGALRRLGA